MKLSFKANVEFEIKTNKNSKQKKKKSLGLKVL